jgi:tRNA threonylcarbamoyladenosine biosynthesis protein TsaB
VLTLALETATDRVGCAIARDDAVVATFELSEGRRHAETLLPAVQACLTQIGAAVTEVGAVVADVGPGLFTGLRVGLATARSLAYALELPTVGVTSLEVLAHDVRLVGRITCAVIDARRGEVFWQLFRPDAAADGVRPLGAPACSPPGDLVAELRGLDEDLVIVGDGVRRYGELFVDLRDTVLGGAEHRYPTAATLAVLGLRALRQTGGAAPETLEPLYLRAPDAAINWSTRDGAVRA